MAKAKMAVARHRKHQPASIIGGSRKQQWQRSESAARMMNQAIIVMKWRKIKWRNGENIGIDINRRKKKMAAKSENNQKIIK